MLSHTAYYLRKRKKIKFSTIFFTIHWVATIVSALCIRGDKALDYSHIWFKKIWLPIKKKTPTLWSRTPLMLCVLDTTLCNKVWQWLTTDRWFSPGTLISSTNNTDRHDSTVIVLNVVLNTITLTTNPLNKTHNLNY